jgi:hypothetical protein
MVNKNKRPDLEKGEASVFYTTLSGVAWRRRTLPAKKAFLEFLKLVYSDRLISEEDIMFALKEVKNETPSHSSGSYLLGDFDKNLDKGVQIGVQKIKEFVGGKK